jgi:hypothetical protein
MAARQYSPKSFLRNAPNSLLQRYLVAKGIGAGLDWAALSETRVEPIFQAVQEAPDALRAEIERDFRDIDGLATEGGVKIIIDEGRFPTHGLELAETLGNMLGYHEQAFWTFLEHPEVFHIARRFSQADHLPGRSWRKRSELPEIAPQIDAEFCERLAQAVAAYYRKKEGRGHACQVDHYQRGERLYWFAYPQDYASTSIEYEEGNRYSRKTRRPAFEVIFVHAPKERSLDLFVKGSSRIVADLQAIWGRAILGAELGPPEKGGVVYELNALKERFPFRLEPGDGVEEVRVKKLRLAVLGSRANKRLTLEANTREDTDAVYQLLDDLVASKRLPLDLLNVTQVGLQFLFRSDGLRGGQRLSFDVSYPNSCSLKYDPKHEIAKRCLKRWKIDVSGDAEESSPQR